ncbi:hypothetical protein LEP1GSC168_2563 [Leptospira santarosai str. HAI134]|nr:hypothetical protein LEP1GSC168_2563 [Leptospira santarosai str. HAI134]
MFDSILKIETLRIPKTGRTLCILIRNRKESYAGIKFNSRLLRMGT